VPRRLDLVLALSRLHRVVAHEPADMTMSVEAGARLGAVNATLAVHGQVLPLDPARAGQSTIGGLIATGAAGPYRARYGTMRDLLLGVTAVRADGTVIHGGGRVVKNVTGYDMPKLLVGALGTLGVVVEAHLRLHPAPADEKSWLFGFPGAEAALAAATTIQETALVPSRLELLDGATLAFVGQAPASAAALAVTIAGLAVSVQKQGKRLVEVCRGAGGEEVTVGDWTRWWTAVSDSAWPTDPGATLVLRIGIRPGDIAKASKAMEAAVGGAVACRTTAEVGNGVLHAVLTGVRAEAAAPLVDRVRVALAPLDGTCVVEHAPPGAKPALEVWGTIGAALGTMTRLKSALDERGILNPGRFVGGI
jgi:glycolate oxidase FAD binding subunit